MSWRRSYLGGGALQDTRASKGLSNPPGQNNCFLNSALQVLWHLDIFRRSFRQISSHRCSGESCVFCALKSIFSEFQSSRRSVLASAPLRSALALAFSSQQGFQLGGMGDAAECFENILMRIHFHISEETSQEDSSSCSSSPCTSSLCIPHQKFSMRLYEQCVCSRCGASSDPLPFNQMIHYISTTSLCNQAVEMLRSRSDASPAMFGELLRNATSVGDLRNCPASCGAQQHIFRVLLNSPEVVTIGLVWDSATSDLAGDLIHSLGTRLRLGDLFGGVEQASARGAELYLVGVVCYYGHHYSSFFYHTRTRSWMYCDDETVTEVGPRWGEVVWRCIRGRYQPLLLLYADPRGAAVAPPPPEHPAPDSQDSGRELSISSDTRTDSSTESCSRPPSSQTDPGPLTDSNTRHSQREEGGAGRGNQSLFRPRPSKPDNHASSAGYHSDGETLKERQAACSPPQPSSSSSSSSSSRRLRDLKETMSSILHSRPLSSSSSSSSTSSFTSSSFSAAPAPKAQAWGAEARAGRGGASWRRRREVLTLDSLFTRERRRQAGYSPLGPSDPGPTPDPKVHPDPDLGPNPEAEPHLPPPSTSAVQGGGIHRTESGYESSERNPSPVDRPPGPLGLRTPCRPSGRSELDKLQDEAWGRAREVQQHKEREMGFNPTPSKVLHLDQLQIQGAGVRAERCVSEAGLNLDQSVRLEKAGEVAAALSVVNEAVLQSLSCSKYF